MNQNHVVHYKDKGVGWIELNRPKALNALTLDMIKSLHNILKAWEDDREVALVCIYGSGEKGYCAGGDVRQLYELKNAGVKLYAYEFFSTEYKMNMLMHDYNKPILSYMNGVVMGGGVGISVGSKYRIVTEKTKWAMPEMNIGLFPDVGGSYFLNKVPGHIGKYLALTSATINGADTLYIGVSDYYILSSEWETLVATIKDRDWSAETAEQDIESILDSFRSVLPYDSEIERLHQNIDEHFSQASVEMVFESLENHGKSGDVWAENTLKSLKRKSPTSLKVTLEQLQRGQDKSMLECFKMELNMGMNFMKGHDFFEGVRSVLVDKDRKPKWNPDKLSDVSEDTVNTYFNYVWESNRHPLERTISRCANCQNNDKTSNP